LLDIPCSLPDRCNNRTLLSGACAFGCLLVGFPSLRLNYPTYLSMPAHNLYIPLYLRACGVPFPSASCWPVMQHRLPVDAHACA
jgi:hypothetical protein